jgi:hypothetical protein
MRCWESQVSLALNDRPDPFGVAWWENLLRSMVESPTRQASNSPITLTLSNKFEVPLDDDSNVRALFVRTKRLVVDVIR